MDQISSSFDLPRLGVSARWARAGERLTVIVVGELDIATAPPLAHHLLEVVRAGDTVVVDLERVEFCGAAGVQLLVELRDHVAALDGRLVLRAPSRPVLKVLAVTQLTAGFEVAGPSRGT